MKPITKFIIFFLILFLSVLLSWTNYTLKKESIIEDLNQALATTIQSCGHEYITKDTLSRYRSNLKIIPLKECAYISLCTDEISKTSFCSDTMTYKSGQDRLYIRAYSNCTRSTIFLMSEQKSSLILLFVSLFWGMISTIFYNKNKSSRIITNENGFITMGGLTYSKENKTFFNENNDIICFTPMQRQIMIMFLGKHDHRISVDEICDTLWPRKENAKETLYTLVRRLKPVINKYNVQLLAEKGHFYRLIKFDK
ncbi:MAG: hypothetical protein RR202_04835 [Bacteroidales bacterium]